MRVECSAEIHGCFGTDREGRPSEGADFNPAGTSAPIGPSQSEFDPLGPSASRGSASRPELFLAPAHPAGRSGNGWA